MLVSICTPIYCAEKYIERCASSLFEQTYPDIEFVFVDDCSHDQSIELLRRTIDRYQVQSKCNIISHNENHGLAVARQTAIQNAHGEAIVWVDSDDWIEKDLVEKAVQTMKEHDADIVCYSYYIHDMDGSIAEVDYPAFNNSKEYLVHLLRCLSPYEVWLKMAKTDIYRHHNISSVRGYSIGEDFAISSQLFYHSSKTVTLNSRLYHYDKSNDNSLTKGRSRYQYESFWENFDFIYSLFENEPDLCHSLKINEAFSICSDLLNLCRFPSNSFYFESSNRTDGIGEDIIRLMPRSKRMILRLSKYKPLLILYGKVAIGIKSLFTQNR